MYCLGLGDHVRRREAVCTKNAPKNAAALLFRAIVIVETPANCARTAQRSFKFHWFYMHAAALLFRAIVFV